MATVRKRNGIEPEDRSDTVAAAQLPISGFGGGTLIETEGGPIPVDWLRPGDRVLTYDDGLQPVRWVGRDCLRQRPQDVATACLAPRLANDRRKPRNTVLAACHRILLTGWQIQMNFGTDVMLAQACDLVTELHHFQPLAVGVTACSLVLLDRPQIILANGCWVESLQLTADAWACLDDTSTGDLERLNINPTAHAQTAAGCLHPWEGHDLGLDLVNMIATRTSRLR